MLKIEVIKFEAQDVITTSVATPKCDCPSGCYVGYFFMYDKHINNGSCTCQAHDPTN